MQDQIHNNIANRLPRIDVGGAILNDAQIIVYSPSGILRLQNPLSGNKNFSEELL